MTKKHPYHDESMWKGAPPESFSKANDLRNRMTKAEKLLWEKIKGNQIQGYKFRRQHPVHLFIVDFYCHKLRLVIEVDGKYHETEAQRLKDEERTQLLEDQGLKIIRFTNEEILNNIKAVLASIEEKIAFLLKP